MTQRSILVIEDEPDIAELVALHLRDESFRVNIASAGHQGMREAFARDWDLILLDLSLLRRRPGPYSTRS